MAGMRIFFQFEAVFAPGSSWLFAFKADALHYDFAAAGSALPPFE
jgi:hypothetical protein